MAVFDVIAFDADDTLWHNEQLYLSAIDRFVDMLSQYHAPEWISERLEKTQMKNLAHFGYGIKAFALTMIETAVELTEGRVSGKDIGALVEEAKKMINADVVLIEGAREAVTELAKKYPLMLITKGDLLDQQRKLSLSGIESCFRYVEVTTDKNTDIYADILRRHSLNPARTLMAGNSPKSDVLPMLELGGFAVHIPYTSTWAHEIAEAPADNPRYFQLDSIGKLPALIRTIEKEAEEPGEYF